LSTSIESEPTTTEKEAQELAIKVFRVIEWDAMKRSDEKEGRQEYARDVLRRAGV
jgi:hypothetical protein